MTEADLVLIRDRVRLTLIERLCLAHFLSQPVLSGQMSVDESQSLLIEWLDAQREKAGELLGAHFREPGMTALYSEEVASVVEKMKEIVVTAANGFRQEMK